jgi:hypothetical protein
MGINPGSQVKRGNGGQYTAAPKQVSHADEQEGNETLAKLNHPAYRVVG